MDYTLELATRSLARMIPLFSQEMTPAMQERLCFRSRHLLSMCHDPDHRAQLAETVTQSCPVNCTYGCNGF